MKNSFKIALVSISASLTSCYTPGSPDPVGETFTHASNAIGGAVNSVVQPAPAHYPSTTGTRQYPTPAPAPVTGYPVR